MGALGVIFAIVVAIFAPASAHAATSTYKVSGDATVSSEQWSTKFGAVPELLVDGSPTVRSYLKFKVANLRPGIPIQSASLRLYTKGGAGAVYAVHGGVTDNSWREASITYASAPSFDMSPVATSPVSGSPGWTEVDVTRLVPGNGDVTFVLTTTSAEAASFMSRETANVPALVIQYPDPILVGAGDIAAGPVAGSGGEKTAALLDSMVAANPGRVTVFTAGDQAYPRGTLQEYQSYYDPTWGRHKAITKPTPGNHEYQTSGAAGYFDYFGEAAGTRGKGYYAYKLGSWRVYSLNSEIDVRSGSEQVQWLRSDLAANSAVKCVLAVFHRPRFSAGTHGSDRDMEPLWRALYDYRADVVVSGHDHNYQRFAPQNPAGVADPTRGIRQFVAGTGGRSFYVFRTPIGNTEAFNMSTFGVLKLVLHTSSYDFSFVPVAGATFKDGGFGAKCL